MNDHSKDQLKHLYSQYQALKSVGLDILKGLQNYLDNTEGIQELSFSKTSLNFTIIDVTLTSTIEVPAGNLVKQLGVLKTCYKVSGKDETVDLEKQFVFDSLGNIESRYLKNDFPPVYLKYVLDYLVHKVKIVVKS